MNLRSTFAVVISLTLAAGIAILAAGCGGGKSKSPTQPTDQPPNPNSPVNAVLLLRWALQHRDTTQYRTLFPNEYVFNFVSGDTAATNHFSGVYGYADERASARHLFVEGSPGRAPATSITLTFNGALRDEPNINPGLDPTVHRMVSPAFTLTVQTSDTTTYNVTGGATFFLVRGDSASLPADLVAAGVRADASRWFIEGWQDQTGGVGIAQRALRPAAGPTGMANTDLITWGNLKVRYLPPAPAAPR